MFCVGGHKNNVCFVVTFAMNTLNSKAPLR